MANSTHLARARRRQYEAVRKERMVAEAAGWIRQYKLGLGCADCGFARWPEALHFDHVDPTTKLRSLGWLDDRTKLTTRSRLEAFKAHVQRYCEVRCANCHAHRSLTSRHWRPRLSARAAGDDLTLF